KSTTHGLPWHGSSHYIFLSKDMDMHLQTEEERKFKCDECGRAYRHAGSLANHKKTHDVGIFQCNICGKEHSNPLALKNHLRLHTSQKSILVRNVVKLFIGPCNTQTESNDSDRPFKCDFCDKSYIHQGSLSNHAKTHQTGTFECGVCFKLFNNMAALHNHQRSHKSRGQMNSVVGPHTATSLDQFFPQIQDEPVHFCHFCQVLFSCEEEFQDHVQIHNSSLLHQDEGALYDNSSASSESLLKPASPCAIGHSGSFDLPHEQLSSNGHFYDCSKQDPASLNSAEMGLSTFIAHNTNNTDSTSAVDAEERPYSCDICSKTYRHYGSLVNHKRSHQFGDYQCPICGKRCRHLAAFKNHIRIHKTPRSLRRQDWLSSELLTMDGQQQTLEHNRPHIVGTEHQSASVLDGHLNQDSGHSFGDLVDIKSENCLSVQQDFTGNIFNESNDHLKVCAENSENDLDFNGLNGNYIQKDEFLQNLSDDGLNCTVAEGQEDDDQDFFQCSFCGNRYSSVRDLMTHMEEHTQSHSPPPNSVPSPMSRSEQVKEEDLGNMLICCLCGKSFTDSQDLVNHQLQHSKDHLDNGQNCNTNKCEVKKNDNLICGSCGIFCSSISHLENHECKDQANLSRTKNDKEMKELNNYADTSLVEEERQFKCEECGRSYRHAGSLLNHKKSHKTGLFPCHVCQKSFYNLLALKNHQRYHFDIKRFQCQECGKAYRTQKQLLNHLKGHKKDEVETLIQINESGSDGGMQSLSTNASQDFHSENTQEELKESKATNDSVDSSDERPFACDQCGRTYRHAGSLVNHKNTHKTGEYLCSICNKAYSNQMSLKNHSRIHFAFKRHSCPKCGKKFKSRKQLSGHVCANLKRRRGFRLNRCARASASSDSSSKEERPFKCDICNRNYRHASSLLNHKNTHKTGHYKCTLCSKHFTNPMALRNHTRIHTQKKKYVCLTCGKAFRVASVLYNHQRVHRGDRFCCPDCGMSFRRRSGLHSHQCPTGQKSGTADLHSGGRDKCFNTSDNETKGNSCCLKAHTESHDKTQTDFSVSK
uniref:Zinc finger protein 646 n=1 Tax=Neogobius melanostomus TaxID=47308 RepID=A0A8C6S4E8_9GOBI